MVIMPRRKSRSGFTDILFVATTACDDIDESSTFAINFIFDFIGSAG